MKLSFATVILALAPGLVSALGVRRDTGKVLQTRKDDPPQYIPITNKYVGKPSSDLFLDPNKLVEDYTSGIGSKIKAIKRHYAARFGRREPQKHAKRNVIQGDKVRISPLGSHSASIMLSSCHNRSLPQCALMRDFAVTASSLEPFPESAVRI